MAKKWIKFIKHGSGVGLGYFEGAVAEVDADKAKAAMAASVALPAEPEEIEKAKAEMLREQEEAAVTQKKAAAKAPVDPVAFFELLQKQSEQIASLTAQVEQLQGGGSKPPAKKKGAANPGAEENEDENPKAPE